MDTALGDSLIQAPIEEVDDLRVGKVSKTDVDLEAGSVIKIEGSSGGQVDITSHTLQIIICNLIRRNLRTRSSINNMHVKIYP